MTLHLQVLEMEWIPEGQRREYSGNLMIFGNIAWMMVVIKAIKLDTCKIMQI